MQTWNAIPSPQKNDIQLDPLQSPNFVGFTSYNPNETRWTYSKNETQNETQKMRPYNPSELSPAGMNDHWLLEKITIVQQGESSK